MTNNSATTPDYEDIADEGCEDNSDNEATHTVNDKDDDFQNSSHTECTAVEQYTQVD